MIPTTLIGLTGYATVGKTTLAQAIVDRFPHFTRRSFATALKLDLRPVLASLDLDQQPKETQRPFFVMYGEVMRIHSPGYWIWRLQKTLDIDRPRAVIIDDVRYPNEANWIQANGGLMLEIRRPRIKAANRVEHFSISDVRSAIPRDNFLINNTGHLAGAIDDLERLIRWHYRRNIPRERTTEYGLDSDPFRDVPATGSPVCDGDGPCRIPRIHARRK